MKKSSGLEFTKLVDQLFDLVESAPPRPKEDSKDQPKPRDKKSDGDNS